MSGRKRSYEFTDVEADHIFTAMLRSIDDGWYYGNRAYFDKRVIRICAEVRRYEQQTAPTKGHQP